MVEKNRSERGDLELVGMSIDVRPYRDLEPSELDEWKRLVKKAHPPGEVRLGSDMRWADLDPETDYLIRLWDEDELRACGWVTQRTVTVSGRESRVAGIRGVVTDPDHRRRGFGRAVMERAQGLMRSFASIATRAVSRADAAPGRRAEAIKTYLIQVEGDASEGPH